MKYIIVYHIKGEYEDVVCIHDFVATFPKDATDAEITQAVGKEWDEVDLYSFISTQRRVFIREEK